MHDVAQRTRERAARARATNMALALHGRTAMELVLSALTAATADDVEVVEHKGIGHPDTICDALAESFGAALGRFYRNRFGRVLHFNVDKALLVGGRSAPAFRGGVVTTPMQMIFAGRATREHRGVPIPVDELAIETGKEWVRKHLHALDPDRHVDWSCRVGAGSNDLVDLFHHPWLANDTSIGAGYAPLSKLERVVLAASARLRELARTRPEVGEDIKVMGIRRRDRIHLTVACAFVGSHLRNVDEYAACRGDVVREVSVAAENACARDVSVDVNAADDLGAGRVYVTVTGTSAEMGDDGEVGRGNRVNGLITPYRPTSLEAAAGKNPVSHVGKLYNVAAHRMAASIAELPEVAEAHCFMLSRIGRKVDDPVVVDVRVRTRNGEPLDAIHPRVEDLVHAGTTRLASLAEDIVAGTVRVY